MEKINNGAVLLGKYFVERWAREPKNKEGYLVIKDFDKLCEDFNKWLNENYPNIDLEKEFKGDVFEELSKLNNK